MQDYFQKQLAINSNIFCVSNVSRSNSLMKCYKVAITGEPAASSLASSLLHVVSTMNQSNCICPSSNDTNVSQFSQRYMQSHENKNKNNYCFTCSGFQDKFDCYDGNNNDESVEFISSKQSKPLDQLKKSQEEIKNNKLLNLNEPIFRITKFRIRTVNNKRFQRIKFKRWRKEDDINVYILLLKYLMKKGIDEETFFRTDISDILDEVNELIINPIYDRIVQQLAIDLYWQRTPYKLLHRIFKLREDKLLERVNQKCTNSKIDPSNIVEYFSEKSQDAVDNQQESLIENIKSE